MRENTLVMPDDQAPTLTQTPADQAAVSTMVAPDAQPVTEAKQRALEKHFSPSQLEALKANTDTTAPTEQPAKASTPKAKSKAPAKAEATPAAETPASEEEIVVDFSAEDPEAPETPGTETEDPENPTLSEDDLHGLDAQARKKLTDAHKEAAKVRKRAQAAEQEATDLKARLAELETQSTQAGSQVPAELNASNSLAHVTDDKVLNAYERDARNVLAILQNLANGQEVESTYRSHVDGQTYDLDHTYAAWAAGTILDVEGRRKQLTVLNKAQATATKIESRLKDTPGFTAALKSITGAQLVTEWPQRRVQAAIGELVTSGQYRLIKISKGTAAGATSPASVTAPTPKKAAPSGPSNPQREPRGTMPSGSPSGETGMSHSRLSQLTEQAMKTGSQDDVKALLKAKMEHRQSNRR